MIAVRIWAKATLHAFHIDLRGTDGRHAHVWTLRACKVMSPEVAEGIDSRNLDDRLASIVAPMQGRDLPAALFAAEALAAHVLLQLETDWQCVEITRPDGSDADAWRI